MIKSNFPSTKSLKRALIAGIPYIGGSLDHLIFDRAEEVFMDNLKKSVDQISERVGKIEEQQLQKDWFESEEALSLFRALLDKVGYDKDESKIETLSQIYALFGTKPHIDDPNKYAVIEVLSKLTESQQLVFIAVNNVPVEEKTVNNGAIAYSGKARWQSKILEFMNNTPDILTKIKQTIVLDVELDILVSFNLLANVVLPNSDDRGYCVTQLGKLAYNYLKEIQ